MKVAFILPTEGISPIFATNATCRVRKEEGGNRRTDHRPSFILHPSPFIPDTTPALSPD